MSENELSKVILDVCFDIHRILGPGLFESVYEEILSAELIDLGFSLRRQEMIPVIWRAKKLDQGFRADLIVEGKVLVEIKSVAGLAPIHLKQVTTYLKLTGIKLGLLINFNESLLKQGIKRVVNRL